MSFNEQYISDGFDDTGELGNVLAQVSELGFDTNKEIPKVFSHTHITEGYDTYDALQQWLEIPTNINTKSAVVGFVFHASRDSGEKDFELNAISAKLYITEEDKREKIAEMSFGKKDGFPTKTQMIEKISDKALSLSRINEIKKKFGKEEHTQTNRDIKNSRRF